MTTTLYPLSQLGRRYKTTNCQNKSSQFMHFGVSVDRKKYWATSSQWYLYGTLAVRSDTAKHLVIIALQFCD